MKITSEILKKIISENFNVDKTLLKRTKKFKKFNETYRVFNLYGELDSDEQEIDFVVITDKNDENVITIYDNEAIYSTMISPKDTLFEFDIDDGDDPSTCWGEEEGDEGYEDALGFNVTIVHKGFYALTESFNDGEIDIEVPEDFSFEIETHDDNRIFCYNKNKQFIRNELTKLGSTEVVF